MFCYECAVQGVQREAIGTCHNCSLALCQDHAHVEPAPVVATYANKTYSSVRGTVELPLKARKLLCQVCQVALAQRLDASTGRQRATQKEVGQGSPSGFHQAA